MTSDQIEKLKAQNGVLKQRWRTLLALQMQAKSIEEIDGDPVIADMRAVELQHPIPGESNGASPPTVSEPRWNGLALWARSACGGIDLPELQSPDAFVSIRAALMYLAEAKMLADSESASSRAVDVPESAAKAHAWNTLYGYTLPDGIRATMDRLLADARSSRPTQQCELESLISAYETLRQAAQQLDTALTDEFRNTERPHGLADDPSHDDHIDSAWRSLRQLLTPDGAPRITEAEAKRLDDNHESRPLVTEAELRGRSDVQYASLTPDGEGRLRTTCSSVSSKNALATFQNQNSLLFDGRSVNSGRDSTRAIWASGPRGAAPASWGRQVDGTEADAKRVVLEEFERQLRKAQQQVDCPLRKAMGGMKL